MDDFGSGYSSLNLLKDVDFDVLKIDLKFFSSTSSKSLKIVESVINLAHELNIPAVAEGVETKEYVDLLKKYKCEYAQGYYYNKPMDLKTFIENYDKN
jgi:EAL domain-containing protein (putative c-di-GMP-specific phosphodiesterase class I)